MNIVFLSNEEQPFPSWKAAFPELVVTSLTGNPPPLSDQEPNLCFVDLACFVSEELAALIPQWTTAGWQVVALSGGPTEQQAFACVAAGARGYCHVLASQATLQQVCVAVIQGQLWLPAAMVQKFAAMAGELKAPSSVSGRPAGFEVLSDREYQVATLVGKGANNREIAEQLSVTERTVKAHLTACFEKLGVRDRVQLALAVNSLPVTPEEQLPSR